MSRRRTRIRADGHGGVKRSVLRPELGLELHGSDAIAETEKAHGRAEPMPHDVARGLLIRMAGRASAGVQLATCEHVQVPPVEIAYLDARDEVLRCAACRPTGGRDRCDQCSGTVDVRRTVVGLPTLVGEAWLCRTCRSSYAGGDAA